MCKCVIVHFSVSYCNLTLCLIDLKMVRAHRFLNWISLAIGEEDKFYILPLQSVTSIEKPINLSCILT